MKNLVIACFAFSVGLSAASSFAQPFDDHAVARKNGWIFNYDEGKALARKTNRPMMLVFRCVP